MFVLCDLQSNDEQSSDEQSNNENLTKSYSNVNRPAASVEPKKSTTKKETSFGLRKQPKRGKK